MDKILHVGPVLQDPPTGVSVYVVSLLNALAQAERAQWGLLSHLPAMDNLPDLDKKIVLLPAPHKIHRNPWSMNPNYPKSVFDIFGKPNLVHFHGVYHPFQSAFAGILMRDKIPYILSLHGGLQPHAQQRKRWKKIFGNAFFFDRFVRQATVIHCLNEAEKEAVQNRCPGKKVWIVPNGVPDSTAALVRPRSPFDTSGVLTVGFLGRLDMHHKGIDFLLDAIGVVQRQGAGAFCRFIFAGPFHSAHDESQFRNLVKRLPNPKAVEYQGVVHGSEKNSFFDRMDLFVHTSRYEGMPGAVLEAMARGISCLVTPGTNMQKLVVQCKGGWTCDLSVKAIVEALLGILGHPKEIIDRGALAKQYVLDCLVWSKIAGQYWARISELGIKSC